MALFHLWIVPEIWAWLPHSSKAALAKMRPGGSLCVGSGARSPSPELYIILDEIQSEKCCRW